MLFNFYMTRIKSSATSVWNLLQKEIPVSFV